MYKASCFGVSYLYNNETAETAIKYFVPISAFRIFNILLIINCKLPASTLFSFDSLYLSVIFYDKFLKRYRTFVKLFCCLNGFFLKKQICQTMLNLFKQLPWVKTDNLNQHIELIFFLFRFCFRLKNLEWNKN